MELNVMQRSMHAFAVPCGDAAVSQLYGERCHRSGRERMCCLSHSATSPNVPSSVMTGVTGSDIEVNELADAQSSDPSIKKKKANHTRSALKHVPCMISLFLCQKRGGEICVLSSALVYGRKNGRAVVDVSISGEGRSVGGCCVYGASVGSRKPLRRFNEVTIAQNPIAEGSELLFC